MGGTMHELIRRVARGRATWDEDPTARDTDLKPVTRTPPRPTQGLTHRFIHFINSC